MSLPQKGKITIRVEGEPNDYKVSVGYFDDKVQDFVWKWHDRLTWDEVIGTVSAVVAGHTGVGPLVGLLTDQEHAELNAVKRAHDVSGLSVSQSNGEKPQ